MTATLSLLGPSCVSNRWSSSVSNGVEGSTEEGLGSGVFTVRDFPQDKIRNFSIVAHVDHGKSTLADRMMEITGAIRSGEKSQFLDKLQVERERGITVKAQTVSLMYTYCNEKYLLNLIDTPGHVDFAYEVSRSLSACQGACLLVDATQGVQAQTVSNFYLAFEQELDLIPVINKIDMRAAEPERVKQELQEVFGIEEQDCSLISAKHGTGVIEVLDKVVQRISPPKGNVDGNLRILLFDAYHDEYRGVICLIEIIDGMLQKGSKITSCSSQEVYEVQELGLFTPDAMPCQELLTGQVGYIITGMKSTKSARIGDTWHLVKQSVEALPGFAPMTSNVFAGLYPTQSDDFVSLQTAMEKLTLNDASVSMKKESSGALGYGFRCGFLGMLHLDVFCQRLEQEYSAQVIITTPTVPYKLTLLNGEEKIIENPCDYPLSVKIKRVEEPTVEAVMVAPEDYTGVIMELCTSRRGTMVEHTHLSRNRVLLKYILGLSELAEQFFHDLKSLTKGYASLDYKEGFYREAESHRMDLLVNGKTVDALARIVHKDRMLSLGRQLCSKMKSLLDRQQFEVVIQASVNGKILCRESIAPVRKNVLAKCYGGDITRKKKLLEKQKEGKKRMKSIGVVSVPQEAFQELVKMR
eukprot:g1143.t1